MTVLRLALWKGFRSGTSHERVHSERCPCSFDRVCPVVGAWPGGRRMWQRSKNTSMSFYRLPCCSGSGRRTSHGCVFGTLSLLHSSSSAVLQRFRSGMSHVAAFQYFNAGALERRPCVSFSDHPVVGVLFRGRSHVAAHRSVVRVSFPRCYPRDWGSIQGAFARGGAPHWSVVLAFALTFCLGDRVLLRSNRL